jgi:hypothetical protein
MLPPDYLLHLSLADLSSSSSSRLKETKATTTHTTELLGRLLTLGVNKRLAKRFVAEFAPSYIEKRIEWYEFALADGQAKGAGYLAASIRDGWGPPTGFKDEPEWKRNGWYTMLFETKEDYLNHLRAHGYTVDEEGDDDV